MQETIARRLLELNREFYQQHGLSFVEARARLQPGVRSIVDGIPSEARVLDVGCGHGLVARALGERGHAGSYCGIDASDVLLRAAQAASPQLPHAFHRVDLSEAGWTAGLTGPYDIILCLAVLHHLPGERLRQAVAGGMASLLAPLGRIVISVWDFLASERLRGRVQAWERLGLSAAEVDPGDYLLDWRRGASGLRYVHAFQPGELEALARRAGLRAGEARHADGEAGRLGFYQTWRHDTARRPLAG